MKPKQVNYGGSNPVESWGYDASGNRTGYTTGSTTKTSVFDELNRMSSSNSSGKSYTHDKVGNRLTTDEGNTRQTMGWDVLNRMTTLTDSGIPGSNPMPIWGVNAEYYYRADGMQTMKVVHPQTRKCCGQ